MSPPRLPAIEIVDPCSTYPGPGPTAGSQGTPIARVTIFFLGGFWRDVSEKAGKFYKSGSPLSDRAIKAVNEFQLGDEFVSQSSVVIAN